jgi:hypothetical protein
MLNLELVSAEAARPTGHPDAQDYILRGHGVRSKAPSQENSTEAVGLFEQAWALDRSQSQRGAGWRLNSPNVVLANMTDTAATDMKHAEVLVDQAWPVRPATRLHISQKVRYCVHKTDTTRRFLNTKQR